MARLDQVNALLSQELALLLPQYIAVRGGLVTITGVRCTADLRWANVYVSILPEKFAGTVLGKLRRQSGQITKQLQKRVKIRRIPKFNWLNDATESKAAEIDEVFKHLHD